MSNESGITIETIDGTLDLADVSWQEIAPSGVVVGVLSAWLPKPYDHGPIVTAEQAGLDCHEGSKREYAAAVKAGYVWRARERRAAVDEMGSVAR